MGGSMMDARPVGRSDVVGGVVADEGPVGKRIFVFEAHLVGIAYDRSLAVLHRVAIAVAIPVDGGALFHDVAHFHFIHRTAHRAEAHDVACKRWVAAGHHHCFVLGVGIEVADGGRVCNCA